MDCDIGMHLPHFKHIDMKDATEIIDPKNILLSPFVVLVIQTFHCIWSSALPRKKDFHAQLWIKNSRKTGEICWNAPLDHISPLVYQLVFGKLLCDLQNGCQSERPLLFTTRAERIWYQTTGHATSKNNIIPVPSKTANIILKLRKFDCSWEKTCTKNISKNCQDSKTIPGVMQKWIIIFAELESKFYFNRHRPSWKQIFMDDNLFPVIDTHTYTQTNKFHLHPYTHWQVWALIH